MIRIGCGYTRVWIDASHLHIGDCPMTNTRAKDRTGCVCIEDELLEDGIYLEGGGGLTVVDEPNARWIRRVLRVPGPDEPGFIHLGEGGLRFRLSDDGQVIAVEAS